MCDASIFFLKPLDEVLKPLRANADILASHHNRKDFCSFWKATDKINIKPTVPVCVSGVSDATEIINMFMEHFKVKSPLEPSSSMMSAKASRKVTVTCSVKEINLVVMSMTRG